jgi:hypothetical protein
MDELIDKTQRLFISFHVLQLGKMQRNCHMSGRPRAVRHSDYRTVSPYWVLPVYVELIWAVWADYGDRPLLFSVPNRGPNQGRKWGSQIEVPNRGPKSGCPKSRSKSGSKMGVPNQGPKSGSQIGVPYQSPPKSRSQIGVLNRGPKSDP